VPRASFKGRSLCRPVCSLTLTQANPHPATRHDTRVSAPRLQLRQVLDAPQAAAPRAQGHRSLSAYFRVAAHGDDAAAHLYQRRRVSGVEWSGVEWSGVEWSEVEWSGVEWSGVKWSGVEWSGVEWSGVE
jgi:hypothetical protein